MFGRRCLCAGYQLPLLLLLLFQACHAIDSIDLCPPSSCGNIRNISYPFRLQNDPPNCGHHDFSLLCEDNLTILRLNSGKFVVQAINYDNFTIRVVDSGVQKDNCSSLPRFPLELDDDSPNSVFYPYVPYKYKWKETASRWFPPPLSQTIVFITCANPANSPLYVDIGSCIHKAVPSNSSLSTLKTHSYVTAGDITVGELKESCTVDMMTLVPTKDFNKVSFVEIHSWLAYGFELSWYNIYCRKCRSCYVDESNHQQCLPFYRNGFWENVLWVTEMLTSCVPAFVGYHIAITLFGTPCIIAFFIYKWRRRHLSTYDTIEEFLQNHHDLMPIRYSYSEIKRMTVGFKDKLGEGGFGCVYKGKLRSGRLAAIKMLGKPKANGQDFINEVATMGRIHHTNVVQLIGFCVEGSKHALVYDFMSNGSLDNYIFSQEGFTSLSWERLFEISLGVARGIEYLHRGCEMQILHFDIKPHNILLDQNFAPKLSDFGLAKLYSTKDSIASLTAARGTIGYMAPELFYKNIGRVSYKADVYSFGMLLLETAGKRKNLNAFVENSSQIYFPSWVYDQIFYGKNLEIGDATVEESKIVRKMIVVGLWCIQMKPGNRPPMNKVVEMLEGDLESLQLPPKPALCPEESSREEGEEPSSISDNSIETFSLVENAC